VLDPQAQGVEYSRLGFPIDLAPFVIDLGEVRHRKDGSLIVHTVGDQHLNRGVAGHDRLREP
jgi:hypothetical protein